MFCTSCKVPFSTAILLELPVSVIKRANLSSLQPSGNAVEVEGVIANSPCDGAFFVGSSALVGLTFDTEIHDMVSADSTVVDDNVPGPQSDSIPLLHLESLLAITRAL